MENVFATRVSKKKRLWYKITGQVKSTENKVYESYELFQCNIFLMSLHKDIFSR